MMKLQITVEAVVPVYVTEEQGIDTRLYNQKREADTKALIEKAIHGVLVKRGAWAPRIRITID